MSYSSRLRSRLDQQTPTKNVGYVGRNTTAPGTPTTFGRVKIQVSEATIEKKYQQDLLGGFKRKNKCSSCNILLPASKICNYCS